MYVRKVFTIVNLAFKENNKWRVSDGSTTYIASVIDTDVLAQIDKNEIAFSKSGRLVCQFTNNSMANRYWNKERISDH